MNSVQTPHTTLKKITSAHAETKNEVILHRLSSDIHRQLRAVKRDVIVYRYLTTAKGQYVNTL